MNYSSPSALALLALIPLLGWRLYARFNRMVGRRRLSRAGPLLALAIVAALALALGFACAAQPGRLTLLALQLTAGAAMGAFGLRKTKFELTSRGLFYTPRSHLGFTLALLLAAGVAVRLLEVFVLDPGVVPGGIDELAANPLALSVFGLFAGYRLAFAIGLLRWRRQVLQAKRRSESELARITASTVMPCPASPLR